MSGIRLRRRKKRNVWIVDYNDAAGVRHRLTAPTREKAEELLAEKIKESRQAAPAIDSSNITVEEYAKRWLDAVAMEIKPRTVMSYRQLLCRYILPVFGPVKLRLLHRGHIKQLLVQKRASGLSKNTVRLIRACLSSMLGYAVEEDGILVTNPALQLGRRRKRVDSMNLSERQKSIRPMSREQLAVFLEAARESWRCYPFFLLLARTGLRPGEAFTLQWPDLDFPNRLIRVERALSAGQIETTKTGQGRMVDMSVELATMLRRLAVERAEEKLQRGWKTMPPWVFCNRQGHCLDDSRVRKHFWQALKRAGLPGFRLYDLRHTYATLLLAQGAPVTYVSA